MKVDTGLQDGVEALRQDNQLSDLTLRVDSHDFRVHRVVLASVSDYFHAMLCGSLKESMSDIVELKEVSAEHISRVLDFIYTGDHSLLKSSPREMLEYGVYFQMPRVIEESQQMLKGSLCISNCLELLSLFLRLPVDDTADTIGKFIQEHLVEVMNHYGPSKMTPEVIQMILDNWKKSEWDLFQYLTSWYKADCDNRKIYMDDFLSHIRFKLLTPDEITAVKKTEVYAECDGTWKGLVDKAASYHQLPINNKVLDRSIQSRVRSRKSVVIMNIGKVAKGTSSTYVLCKSKQKKHRWKRYKAAKQPKLRRECPFAMEVNNYLIVSCEGGNSQFLEVFDPRTLMWCDIAHMPKPKKYFAVVHHGKQLYVLGGREGKKDEYSNTAEVYDFETDSWKTATNLPVAIAFHAACVLEDKIYISGGDTRKDGNVGETARMDCLDISKQTWESKAPMLTAMSDHKMCVMKVNKKDTIIIIRKLTEIGLYDPVTDQWSTCDFSFSQVLEYPSDPVRYQNEIVGIGLCPKSSLVVRGNSLYLLQVEAMQLQYFDYEGNYVQEGEYWGRRDRCVKLTFPEEGSEVKVIIMENTPVHDPRTDVVDQIGTLLAFPARSDTQNT